MDMYGYFENFYIQDIRDPNNDVIKSLLEGTFDFAGYRDVNYRLWFKSHGKKNLEIFAELSTGTQDIFLLLLEIITTREYPLIAIEELENGIHPSLYRAVLNVIDKVCLQEHKRAIITTHSPAVARHFRTRSFSSFYIGISKQKGVANFIPLNETLKERINKEAESLDCSIGEMIIDMISESEESRNILLGWVHGE